MSDGGAQVCPRFEVTPNYVRNHRVQIKEWLNASKDDDFCDSSCWREHAEQARARAGHPNASKCGCSDRQAARRRRTYRRQGVCCRPTPTDSKGVAALVGKGGARSRLATALVCADPASQVYMRAARAGWRPSSAWRTFGHRLSEQVSKAKLLALIASLAPMRV